MNDKWEHAATASILLTLIFEPTYQPLHDNNQNYKVTINNICRDTMDNLDVLNQSDGSCDVCKMPPVK